MKYKVGDKVRIKQWEDMEKEYGLNTLGGINIFPEFSEMEKDRCGMIVTINECPVDCNGIIYYCFEEIDALYCEEVLEDIKEREDTKMKNKMKEVAELLGLDWDDEKRESEHFTIDQYCYCSIVYCINEKGLMIVESGETNGFILEALFTGEYTLSKLPWKPKEGGNYYYVAPSGNILKGIFIGERWAPDISMLKNGWCFKTEEEAEANKERVLKEMREVLK